MSILRPDAEWKSYAIFGVACALIVGIYCWIAEPGFYEVVNPCPEDAYYNLLVQGFRSGQLNVNRELPAGLAALPNPYDPAANAPYLWNVGHISYELSYYNGKLYLYHGVTPAVVFFWPYAALTGGYCTHKAAVVFFLAMGFLIAAGLMFAAWKRYFAETSLWSLVAAVFALGLATGFVGTLSSCDEHQVPHLCGFAFAMLALAAIWNSLHHPRWQMLWLACASLAYGLAVGARPSLLFGIVIVLIPVAQAWLAATEPSRFKRTGWLLLAAVVPAALVGGGLAAYNALRFGSPFEFGWRYLLTDVQNVSTRPFDLNYFWFNWKLYFLEPVHWASQFPFLRPNVPSALPANYYGVGEPYCGIFLNYPVAWLAGAAVFAWRGRPQADAARLRWFLLGVFLLFAINAMTMCCFFSGSSGYLSDFFPPLMLLAAVGLWSLERALRNRPPWCWLARLGWCLLLAYSIVFGILAGIKTRANTHFVTGNSFAHQGQTEKAVEHYQKAVAFDPGSSAFRIGLGNACVKRGNLAGAIVQYQKVIATDPGHVEARYDLSLSLVQSGRVDEAARHFQTVMERNPAFLDSQDPAVNNNFAWALATNPDPAKRNGTMAVALAGAACRKTRYESTLMVGTLAAAYAEAGRFDEAVTTAQKACDLAGRTGEQGLLQKNRELLALYRNHQPYRETPVAPGN